MHAHVHVHDCYDVAEFLDSAHSNFKDAIGPAAGSSPFAGILLLTETSGTDYFSRLSSGSAQTSAWHVHGTGESCSLIAESQGKRLAIVAGRQVAGAEDLEVLMLGTNARVEDGRPIRDLLEEGERLGAAHPIHGRITRPQVQIGGGELRMLDAAPGRLHHLRGAAQIAFPGQQTTGERSGRHQVGREPNSLLRCRECALRIALLLGQRIRGMQHGPLAARGLAINEAERGPALHGPERGRHARSAVGVAELPFGIPVEIEAEVEIDG